MPVIGAGFHHARVVAGHGLLQTRLALRGAIVRDMTHADGRVGLLDLGRVEGVLGDVGAALDERVDAVVDGVDGNDLDVVPGQSRAREVAEHVVPDGEMGPILAGEALALDVVDVLDRRVLPYEQTDHQRRPAHHQPHVCRMRERVAAADLLGRPAIGQPEIHRVLNPELQLAGIDERQHGARARVRLDDHLIPGPTAHDLGDAAGQREEHGAGWISPDGDRLWRLALSECASGERSGGHGEHEGQGKDRATVGKETEGRHRSCSPQGVADAIL